MQIFILRIDSDERSDAGVQCPSRRVRFTRVVIYQSQPLLADGLQDRCTDITFFGTGPNIELLALEPNAVNNVSELTYNRIAAGEPAWEVEAQSPKGTPAVEAGALGPTIRVDSSQTEC